MAKGGMVYVGTYSEPILFGTGQVVQGKGKGISLLPLRSRSGRPRSRRHHRGGAQLLLSRVRSDAEIPLLRQRVHGVRRKSERRCQRTSGSTGTAASSTFLNMKASHGTDPCHLIVDKSGKNVLIANFASGSVCVLPIERDGSLKDASCVIQHEVRASTRSARQARTPTPWRSTPPTVTSSCRSSEPTR